MELVDPIEKLEYGIDERFSFVVRAIEELAKIIAGFDDRLEKVEKPAGDYSPRLKPGTSRDQSPSAC